MTNFILRIKEQETRLTLQEHDDDDDDDITTFCSMCAVSSMAVFCSSLISCFPGMLLSYCLSDCEMVPVAPIITGITFAYTFHMC